MQFFKEILTMAMYYVQRSQLRFFKLNLLGCLNIILCFQDNRTNWRRTYKSLLLLDYLVKNGSERVVTNAREHIYDLRSMENYSFVDENGKIFSNK